MLNVLYILEALRNKNIMPGLLSGWTRKDIEQLPNFFLRLRIKMLNVLYILEALRLNNIMPGLLPEWTRKDIEQLPNFLFRLRIDMLNKYLLYILEGLRHNNNMPGLLPGWTRKDIELQPNVFFRLKDWNAKRVIYPRSAQAKQHHARTSIWVNQKGYRTNANLFFLAADQMLTVLYILEGFRNNNILPGLLPGWTKKNRDQ